MTENKVQQTIFVELPDVFKYIFYGKLYKNCVTISLQFSFKLTFAERMYTLRFKKCRSTSCSNALIYTDFHSNAIMFECKISKKHTLSALYTYLHKYNYQHTIMSGSAMQ